MFIKSFLIDATMVTVFSVLNTHIPTCLPPSHVQVSNDDAKEFYQKFGFHIVDTKEQYYKRIDPPHAFVLQKDLKGPLGLPIVS